MVGCLFLLSRLVPPKTTPLYRSTSSPTIVVSPITTPIPWSIKNLLPIVAPGCISIPVKKRFMCEIYLPIRR